MDPQQAAQQHLCFCCSRQRVMKRVAKKNYRIIHIDLFCPVHFDLTFFSFDCVEVFFPLCYLRIGHARAQIREEWKGPNT